MAVQTRVRTQLATTALIWNPRGTQRSLRSPLDKRHFLSSSRRPRPSTQRLPGASSLHPSKKSQVSSHSAPRKRSLPPPSRRPGPSQLVLLRVCSSNSSLRTPG